MAEYRILDLRDGKVDPLGRTVGDDWLQAIIAPGLYVTTDRVNASMVPDLPLDDVEGMLAEVGLADASDDDKAAAVLEMCKRGAEWRRWESHNFWTSEEGRALMARRDQVWNEWRNAFDAACEWAERLAEGHPKLCTTRLLDLCQNAQDEGWETDEDIVYHCREATDCAKGLKAGESCECGRWTGVEGGNKS